MAEQKIPEEFFDKYPEAVVPERFERIWKEINDKWGTQLGTDYLEGLVVVEGGRQRAGFDLTVMGELLYLAELHAKQFPQFRKPLIGEDPWELSDLAHD